MSKYNMGSSRSEDQAEEMRRLAIQDICIFCPEHIHQDPNPIEISTEHWMVKKNRYAYENTKLHLVLIPKKHVKKISDLPRNAQQEFLELVVKCEKHYKLNSYAVGFRSGDMRLNGGSIEHIHAHLIVGDVNNPNHEPVRFKMSSKSN